MKRKFLVMAAVIIGSQLSAQDSASVTQLNEVVVTANKLVQKISNTGKMITVISQQVLQQNAGKSIAEIINFQSGLFINGASNNPGTNPDLYFRGSGTGNTLILIDGIPVGDPSQINNIFDLNMITPGQVERIEILKGAQSTLWGSDAVAGVINIITRKESGNGFHPTLMLSGGSYKTFRGNIGLNGRLKKLSYNLSYDGTSSAGFSTAYDSTGTKGFDADNFKQNNVQVKLNYHFNEHFTLHTLNSFSGYAGGTDAGAFKDDKDYTFENKNELHHIELSYAGSKWQGHLSQSFFKASRVYTDDSVSVGGFSKYQKGNYHGNSAVTELYGNYSFSKKLVLVSGLQSLMQQTDQDYLSISMYGPYKTALGDSARIQNIALYQSLLMTGLSGFDIEAGYRINHHNIYGNNVTYTFNPSFHCNRQTKLFVNISSAFKVPSLYQLYSEYGNKNLKPEQSVNYELGVQVYSQDQFSNIRIAAFKRDINHLIVYYSDPITWSSMYINRDQQHDYGFELESVVKVGLNSRWTTNLTYVNGEGESKGVSTKNLYRRPNFTANTTFSVEAAKGFTVIPSIQYVGTRIKGTYDAGPDIMPAYCLFNLNLGYSIHQRYRAFIDVKNIANQQYFDVPGYNSKRFNLMAGISMMW